MDSLIMTGTARGAFGRDRPRDAMPNSPQTELIRQLQRTRALHEQRASSPALAAALDRLAYWQSRRLQATYADLARDERYAAAVEFFGTELYGPGDFSRRDADLARVVPLMARVLPGGVLAAVAGAIELSALSQELDRELLEELDPTTTLTVSTYCEAYRRSGNRRRREVQIALIVSVGQALDRYVSKPIVRSALGAMRQPARLAGFGALQGLLERGFAAFRRMRGAREFLHSIETRETELMNAIFGGDPAPFPEP
jgi:hypothetical protein